ncbi:small-conductance mechanosensitive channel [Saonia flava]|uniref:Small-conductance mechanosensitive channel n=1 Tax=Saonia flava TaxID=523696 RepID=A0A846QW19_9FLAO|nr:mechanosensitive ion channel domain-containing protein [Saonia flava]NJB72188.1 small-conductance mechanosensitive channel [Saonia flava]
MDAIKQWLSQNSLSLSVLKYLAWVIFILVVVQFFRRYIKKNLPDSTTRYRSQKGIEIFGYLLLIILTLSYFTGNIKDFTLAIGLFTAGITITLQELILSIAGSIYIFVVKVYKPGDRVQINGIKGDIIDIDSIYTTMMEIGEWVTSDNYSGRIVKLSNAFVFRGPIYNYSQDFPFIWDEFDLPIRYGSDVELAKTLFINVATEVLNEYTTDSLAKWKDVVGKYYIEDAVVAPTLAISMTDNWISFNLRYIVDYKKRRMTKHVLNEKIHQEVEKTNGKVVLASATIEIIRLPEVTIQK